MLDSIRKKKLCIFDLDGTLVRSDSAELPFFFDALTTLHDADISRSISDYPDRSFASVINSLKGTDKLLLSKALESKMLEFVTERYWEPLEEGVLLFKTAKKLQIPTYIVSGNFHKPSLKKIESVGLDLDTDSLLTTNVDNESKLSIIQSLMHETQCSGVEVLSIGDSAYDERIAQELCISYHMVDL